MEQYEVTGQLDPHLVARAVATDRLHMTVHDLRREGATWVQIGNALGTSPQAAQQRFASA